MSLLTPDTGLLFWMLISFGIVFFILAKFGFPIIIKMVEERKAYIDQSVQSAKEANEKLAGIKAQSDKILAETKEEQLRLLREATEMKNQIIKEAKQQAGIEADKVMEEARKAIQKEKDDAIKDIRNQVVDLSIQIAEKILRKDLEDKAAQKELINKLMKEAENSN